MEQSKKKWVFRCSFFFAIVVCVVCFILVSVRADMLSVFYPSEVESAEPISTLESSAIKSAEQSVYGFFAAIQKKDYDTLNRVSMNKLMSEDMLINIIELQHEEGLIPEEPPIILSSEQYSEDKVLVKVSYLISGEEHIMTYPVILVNNQWIVNAGDPVRPSTEIILWPGEVSGI